jgi:uncharacterized phage infection (PIP) family protein YhgE
MKLGKDQIQKLALGALVLAAMLYAYFTMLLGPLATKQAKAEKAIHELEPQILEAKKQLQKTEQVRKQAPAANAVFDQLKSKMPEGAPVAWFPPRMAEFFKRQGLDKTLTRLINEVPVKELPGFRKLVWAIDLPKAEFAPLGIALAALENEEPLLQITNITVEATKDDPQNQHAILTVATLVKQ